ncbi:hypothetical protein THAOC_16466, partial [Thalassiosira oceanica]
RLSARPAAAYMAATRTLSSMGPIIAESAMDGSDKSLNRMTRDESIYKLGKHRSNALELIQKVPPIEVDGDIAVCDGGGGALGHPVVSFSRLCPPRGVF